MAESIVLIVIAVPLLLVCLVLTVYEDGECEHEWESSKSMECPSYYLEQKCIHCPTVKRIRKKEY